MGVEDNDARKGAFEWSSKWRKLSYTIENQEGIDVITAVYGSEEDWYDPLDFRFDNRPKYPEEIKHQDPGIALARINPNNYDDILEYANRWGLLGLWNVNRYRLAENLEPRRRYATDYKSGKYSTWYNHPRKRNMFSWQEPIRIFSAAVTEYQEILGELFDGDSDHNSIPFGNNLNRAKVKSEHDIDCSEGKASVEAGNDQLEYTEVPYISDADTKNQINRFRLNFRINDYMSQIRPALSWNYITQEWIPGWSFLSLLDAIYLLLFLNLQANRYWRRCKRLTCHDFFLAGNPKAVYCSDTCANTQAKIDSRNNKLIRSLTKLYPHIDNGWLIEQGESILKKGGIGEKKLHLEIEKRIVLLRSAP